MLPPPTRTEAPWKQSKRGATPHRVAHAVNRVFTDPSTIVGEGAPISLAFFCAHSRAMATLWSAPALSLHNVKVMHPFGVRIRRHPVRDVRIRAIDVDVIEEMLLHEHAVTARMRRFDSDVLVEIERNHVAEAVVLAAAPCDDAFVHLHRRASCGKSEDDARIAADRG